MGVMNIEQIGKNIDAIRIARGFTKSELARKANISPQTLQHHLANGRMTIETLAVYAEALGCTIADIVKDSVDLTAFESTKDLKDCYPFNLATAVMGVETDCISKTGLDMALDELTERERTVLKERFLNKMTLRQCAEKHETSQERIRQIEAKALRKLRHPARATMFLLSPREYTRELEAENGKLRLEIATLKMHVNENNEKAVDISESYNQELLIDDLELSVRSFNCLARKGIRKVSDLTKLSRDDLIKIRNLGRKCAEEIETKLKAIGFTLKGDEIA